jgi:hypothetical protein
MKTPIKPWAGTLRPITAFTTALALVGGVSAAMLPDAKPKEWPPSPENHKVVIRREAADEKQKAMITTAEAALPDIEALREAAAPEKPAVGDGRWWYKIESGTRIPFAITADAVAHYAALVEANGKRAITAYVEPRSNLDYRASAVFHKEFAQGDQTFRNVHVVTLKLRFSQHFVTGQTEGVEFAKERVVVLDETGKVLLISGDGPTQVAILAI